MNEQGIAPASNSLPEMKNSYRCLLHKEPDRVAKNPSNHKLSPSGGILAKSILFACSLCDGPLIQASQCIVCKKTAIRRCIHCGSIRDLAIHDSCKNLVILGNEVSSCFGVNDNHGVNS